MHTDNKPLSQIKYSLYRITDYYLYGLLSISVSRINITSSTGVDVVLKEFHWDDCISDFTGIIHFYFILYLVFRREMYYSLLFLFFILLYLYNIIILLRLYGFL